MWSVPHIESDLCNWLDPCFQLQFVDFFNLLEMKAVYQNFMQNGSQKIILAGVQDGKGNSIKECSHKTKFNPLPKFSPILFCIRKSNLSPNESITHRAWKNDWHCLSMNVSVYCRATHFLSVGITGRVSLRVHTHLRLNCWDIY